MEIWAVIVAGGSGTRFGRPKQLAALGDRRVIDHAIDPFRGRCAGVVVVGSDELGSASSLGVDRVAVGGATRSASVRHGLALVPPPATHVLVHDAARPLVGSDIVDRVIEALAGGARAVVPVVPVTDTLRTVDGMPADRDRLRAVQTPQGFELAALLDAHGRGGDATDDATVVQQAGIPVVHVDGSPRNLKITFPHDLAIAEALLAVTGPAARS